MIEPEIIPDIDISEPTPPWCRRASTNKDTIALLPYLKQWGAVLHTPCSVCGCMAFYKMGEGLTLSETRYRCLYCWPPADQQERIRRILS